MFSMFPDGWPGAGLLLLRVAVGAVLIIEGAVSFGFRREPGVLVLAVVSALGVLGFLLLVGFLTRLAAFLAAIVCLGSFLSWFPGSNGGMLVTPPTAALCAVIAAAVVCLGPGAFSFDARLFGRREIVIPKSASENSKA
jgi:putative oxidoreductase